MLGGWKAMKSMKDIRYKSVFESFQGWVPTFSKMTQIGKYLEANSGGGVLKLLKMTQFRLVPRYQLVVVLKFFEKTKISVCLAVKYTLSGNPPPCIRRGFKLGFISASFPNPIQKVETLKTATHISATVGS